MKEGLILKFAFTASVEVWKELHFNIATNTATLLYSLNTCMTC